MALKKEAWKTVADMEALPEGTMVELIDGVIYDMAAPTVVHQRLVSFLTRKIGNYIDGKNGACEVFPSPFDVQLDKDDYTLVQPDVSVICDRTKLDNGKRCIGAPDWIIEIVSPSTGTIDYSIKLDKYRTAGVREYWIIDPAAERILIYYFENGGYQILPLKSSATVGIYPDFEIDFSTLALSISRE